MKQHYILQSIITATFLFILIFVSTIIKGQASFVGGLGGGYSMVEVTTGTTGIVDIPTNSFEVTIFPNPVSKNQVLKAKINGFEKNSKIKIVVSDMIGFQIFIQEVDIASEISINLPFEKLSKGIYLISFQHSKNKITRRFSYTD
jgi:hypothetical protein